MNWIRIATKMKGDPRVGAIAASCRVRVAEATGLICCVLMELPDHARDGDVSAVPDVILEQWAMWSGKPGVFAAAFRAQLCDETGVIRAWERYNGAAIRKSDADNARRKPARNPTETRQKPARVFGETRPKPDGDGTGRDVTTPTEAVGVVSARGAPAPAAAGSGASRLNYRAQFDELLAAGLPHERAALEGLVRNHPAPDVLVLELHAIASGLHLIRGSDTGRAAEIADVMRAVAEMVATDKPFSVSLFRGFVRRIANRPPEPASAEDREAARLAREIAARQPTVPIEAPRSPEEIERLSAQRAAAMAAFRAEFYRNNPTAGLAA